MFVNKIVFIGFGPHSAFIKNNLIDKYDNKISIQSAFVPPDISEKNEILGQYPKNIYKKFKSFKYKILVNASKIVFWNNNDLYGLDMAIDLLGKLEKEYPELGLILCISNFNNKQSYLNDLINKSRIKNKILLINEKKLDIWPLIKQSTIFIRPTNVDAYAVSLEEALYLKTISIASDASERPKGVILFKSRDENDLYLKTKKALFLWKEQKQ